MGRGGGGEGRALNGFQFVLGGIRDRRKRRWVSEQT